ncbi:beta-lactamase [Shewanella sediminis HAW-EB3]|uniref:Beta-lactamase n=1 Tax=Shewanella sediminis (strain HAW-EB3) TaxID=425104 RepID=A8FZ47_SHESH|nr:serine hydrolase [Shewanella sediminis]ABV38120.1 beta-lactamase [Shewanella sediminis HAW-EB3]
MKLRIGLITLRRSVILLGLLTAPAHADFPPPGDSSSPENSQSEQAGSQKLEQNLPLENRVREAIDNSLQPFSGSILLTEGGNPLLSMHKGRGINGRSSFVIASLSKQITATLILQAVDAGKLQLDRSLNSYRFQNETLVDSEQDWDQEKESEPSTGFNAKFETRPETEPESESESETEEGKISQVDEDGSADSTTVTPQNQAKTTNPELLYGTSRQTSQEQPRFNPNRFDERITLHHLLSHTSGIDQLGKPNRFEPGSKFQYSNYGYTILGELLEQVNQQTLPQQIADFKLAYRLGGLYAEVGDIDDIRQRAPALAIGLTETANGLTQSDLTITASLIPAGGIISTTKAFSDFQIKLHAGKFISPKSYQLMTTPHTEIDFLWSDMSYGYGLRLNFDDNLTEYSHTGYLSGYMSMTLYYPQFNLGLVMLENISLNLNSLDRVFELHNQVRAIIRNRLISAQIQDVK